MTPEQQRIAIAEWCGWKWYRRPATGPWADKPMRALYHPDLHAEYIVTLKPADMSERACNSVFIWREGMVPDYINDLNAMHGAEKGLNVDQIGDYENRLYGITDYRDSVTGEAAIFWSQHSFYRNIHATAAQRAEALLRTIGKWID